MMRKILSLIIVFWLSLFVRNAVGLELPQIGKPAPDFALNDMNGKKSTLSGYKGKVVILNFWATFCGPCKDEMPSLNNLYLAFEEGWSHRFGRIHRRLRKACPIIYQGKGHSFSRAHG